MHYVHPVLFKLQVAGAHPYTIYLSVGNKGSKVSTSTSNFSLSSRPCLRSQQPSTHEEKVHFRKPVQKTKKEDKKKWVEKLQQTVMRLTVVLALRPDQEHRCTEQQREPQIHKAEHV